MESTQVETLIPDRELITYPSWDIVSLGVLRRSAERRLKDCIKEAGCIPTEIYSYRDYKDCGTVLGMRGIYATE